MHIITFANNKGGVGKTTSALNVAQALAVAGHLTLLIDCDPQANLTDSFDLDPRESGWLTDALAGKDLLPLARRVGDNLYLVAANTALRDAEPVFGAKPTHPFAFRKALAGLMVGAHATFDYVIFDTPPAIGPLTTAALVASHAVFIPAYPDKFGYDGLNKMLDKIEELRDDNMNPKLQVGGIFFTKFNQEARRHRKIDQEFVQFMADTEALAPLLMQTSIRENVALREAVALKQSIFAYKPDSAGAEDYNALAAEVQQRIENPVVFSK